MLLAQSVSALKSTFTGCMTGQSRGGEKVKIDSNIERVIQSALCYYKLRKLKLMFAEVEDDLKNQTDMESSRQSQQIYLELKRTEIEITQSLGTVILK